jgi:hypothetical protein
MIARYMLAADTHDIVGALGCGFRRGHVQRSSGLPSSQAAPRA